MANVKQAPKVEDEAELDEETQAASSLHPAARAVTDDPKSKVEILKSMIGKFAEMPHSDLNDFYNKTMSQFGPGKDWGVGDKSASNSASINMKPSAAEGSGGASAKEPMPHLSVKEDVEAMFKGQDLSEEFKEKVTVVFEAAVGARCIVETLRLEEEFDTKLNEAVEEMNEELSTKLDGYLEYVVENWMKENEVAIESTIRTELTNEFLEGLKALFTEHYIDVPEDKVDVVATMAEKVTELEDRLNAAINENNELKETVTSNKASEVIEAAVAELTVLSSQEKFRKLAEGLEFDGDVDTFAKKLQIVKENYFPEKSAAKETNLVTEEFDDGTDTPDAPKSDDPMINRYADAISRGIHKLPTRS